MPNQNTNYKFLSTHHLQHDEMNVYKDKQQSLGRMNEGCPPVNSMRAAQYTPDYLVNRTDRLAATGRANYCQAGNGTRGYEFWNAAAGRCVGNRSRRRAYESCPEQSCFPCTNFNFGEKLSGI